MTTPEASSNIAGGDGGGATYLDASLRLAKLQEELAVEKLKMASTKVRDLEKVIKDGYQPEKKGKKKAMKRKRADPSSAKRPLSGYQFYMKENYDAEDDKMNSTQKVAAAWKSLAEREKIVWGNRARDPDGNNAYFLDRVGGAPQSQPLIVSVEAVSSDESS